MGVSQGVRVEVETTVVVVCVVDSEVDIWVVVTDVVEGVAVVEYSDAVVDCEEVVETLLLLIIVVEADSKQLII